VPMHLNLDNAAHSIPMCTFKLISNYFEGGVAAVNQ
jgi:hypothetical protein